MGQVASHVEEERTPLIPGHGHGGTPGAAAHNQGGGSWSSWIRNRGIEFWSRFMNCCGVTMEGLRACCMGCCNGIWTFMGCFGCCAATYASCGSLLTSCSGWFGPRCPLSKKFSLTKKAFADFLDNVATVGVMGILSLNVYCATYFLTWAKDSSYCTPRTWVKVIVVGLPFTTLPLTLYISGQAKALQRDLRGVGLVSGLVILEVLYILSMGGIMTVCMSESPWLLVTVVTCFLSVLLILGWGCCCHSPKCLRVCLRRCCFWENTCQEIDEEAPVPAVAMTELEAAAAGLQAAAAAAAVALHAPTIVRV